MYERRFYATSLRYARTTADAEDIVIQGFTKIFSNINSFKDGNFESWMRTIIVNEALSLYRKDQKQTWNNGAPPDEHIKSNDFNVLDTLGMGDLLLIIQDLPEGSRVVFNLFAIEGYGHKEIAEMLNINEGTSKSQYSRAKELLKNKLTPLES